MSKASRGKKGEAKVAKVLEGLPDSFRVFNDGVIINETSEMTHQMDHILIHPHGLFVIETKNYFGEVMYDEEEGWSRNIRGRYFHIADPLRQNKAHAIVLRKALKAKYKPVPVVVFVRDNAPFLGDENVINLSDLPLFIDSYPYEHLYSKAELSEMEKAVEGLLVSVSNAEHVENIEIMKQVRKELEAEMTYAIEQRKCPRCDGDILVDGYDYRCCRCSFRFRL